MRIFVSWSGERGMEMASVLRGWLKDLLHSVDPWASTEDLRKGTVWISEIGGELKNAGAGIVCLTPESLHEDWVLFEAGGIAGPGRPVWTYLLDLEPSDVTDPLAQFNHTRAEKDDTLRMVKAINERLEEDQRLDDVRLERAFDQWWPNLEEKLSGLKGAAADTPTEWVKREDAEILEEVLELVRQQSHYIRRMGNAVGQMRDDSVRRPDRPSEAEWGRLLARGGVTLVDVLSGKVPGEHVGGMELELMAEGAGYSRCSVCRKFVKTPDEDVMEGTEGQVFCPECAERLGRS